MKYYIIAGEASGDLHGSNLMKALFKQDPSSGCSESSSKKYFQVLNKGASGINCVSVRILNNKEEIYSPNINQIGATNLAPRKAIIKKFIEEGNIKFPDQMIRREHFFNVALPGQKLSFTWILFTDLTSDNLTEEKIDNHIVNAIDMHKGFENDLKLKADY